MSLLAMGQALTSPLLTKDCYSNLPLARRQFWSIGCRSGLPFFYACACLFHGLLTHPLPDVIPAFVSSQSVLCKHPTRRKSRIIPGSCSSGQALSCLKRC